MTLQIGRLGDWLCEKYCLMKDYKISAMVNYSCFKDSWREPDGVFVFEFQSSKSQLSLANLPFFIEIFFLVDLQFFVISLAPPPRIDRRVLLAPKTCIFANNCKFANLLNLTVTQNENPDSNTLLGHTYDSSSCPLQGQRVKEIFTDLLLNSMANIIRFTGQTPTANKKSSHCLSNNFSGKIGIDLEIIPSEFSRKLIRQPWKCLGLNLHSILVTDGWFCEPYQN